MIRPVADVEGLAAPSPFTKNLTPAVGLLGLLLWPFENRRLGPSQHEGLDPPMHRAALATQRGRKVAQ